MASFFVVRLNKLMLHFKEWLTETRKTATVHPEISKWVSSADKLKQAIEKLKDILKSKEDKEKHKKPEEKPKDEKPDKLKPIQKLPAKSQEEVPEEEPEENENEV